MKTQNTTSRSSHHPRKLPSFHGFTLVELIVVISILTILATISFFAIKDYYGSSRDSVRVTDIQSIQKGLSLLRLKTGTYFLPDGAIQIDASPGIILSYQGYAGENVGRAIKINKTPIDPKDATKYTYTVDKSYQKVQLMGYLESGDAIKSYSYNQLFPDTFFTNIITASYAATSNIDYKNRFIYVIGDTIGVLTDTNKAPIQEAISGTGITLATSSTGYVAYFGGTQGKSTGTGDILVNQMLVVTSSGSSSAPTIASVTAAQLACNSIRFTINGAADSTVGLHATPYSFDGGSTWQASKTKDYASTNQTIGANQIKVRNASGFTYVHASSVNGTSASCAVNCTYTTYQGGSCSASCGGGNYATYYTKTVVENALGTCAISEGQFAGYNGGSCNTQACPTSGPYSYGGWSGCSASCGGGTQTQSYSCAYDSCYHTQATSQSCNTQACIPYECGYNSCSSYWTTCAGACSSTPTGDYSACATCNGQGLSGVCTTNGGVRSECWGAIPSCNATDYVSPSEAAYWTVTSCSPNYSTTCAPNYSCQQTSCTYISQTCYY